MHICPSIFPSIDYLKRAVVQLSSSSSPSNLYSVYSTQVYPNPSQHVLLRRIRRLLRQRRTSPIQPQPGLRPPSIRTTPLRRAPRLPIPKTTIRRTPRLSLRTPALRRRAQRLLRQPSSLLQRPSLCSPTAIPPTPSPLRLDPGMGA